MAVFAEVLVEFLPTEKGGRQAPVYLSTDSPANYRPHFRVLGGDGEYLGVEFVDGPDGAVSPGDITYATVRFVYEQVVCYNALVVGAQFEVMGRVSRCCHGPNHTTVASMVNNAVNGRRRSRGF